MQIMLLIQTQSLLELTQQIRLLTLLTPAWLSVQCIPWFSKNLIILSYICLYHFDLLCLIYFSFKLRTISCWHKSRTKVRICISSLIYKLLSAYITIYCYTQYLLNHVFNQWLYCCTTVGSTRHAIWVAGVKKHIYSL